MSNQLRALKEVAGGETIQPDSGTITSLVEDGLLELVGRNNGQCEVLLTDKGLSHLNEMRNPPLVVLDSGNIKENIPVKNQFQNHGGTIFGHVTHNDQTYLVVWVGDSEAWYEVTEVTYIRRGKFTTI